MEFARIHWLDGTPSAPDFGDIYFNPQDGAAESAHVFLAGNALKERFIKERGGWFCVGETGFGTGLNFLQCWALWEQTTEAWQQLHFVSFERFPMHPDDIRRSLSRWPGLAEYQERLLNLYSSLVPGWNRFNLGRVHLTLYIGAASDGLADSDARVHAWFLDGFSPNCNADLWQPSLFHQLAALSVPGTTLATFTVARSVRDGLSAAGFLPQRVPGYGRKRHNLSARFIGLCGPWRPSRATRTARWPRPEPRVGSVGIIGGGIAAAELAPRLQARGLDVTVITPESHGAGASGNRHAAVYVNPGLEADPPTTLYAAALSYRCRHWAADWPGDQCGVLQLLSKERAERYENIAKNHPFQQLARRVTADEASRIAGVPTHRQALWIPHSGWLSPVDYCRKALADSHRWAARITAIERQDSHWRVIDTTGTCRHFTHVVVAAGSQSNSLLPEPGLPLQPIRGQVSSRRCRTPLRTVLCGEHYATPVDADGWWSYGATFQLNDTDEQTRIEDEYTNLHALRELAPLLAGRAEDAENADTESRAGVRVNTPDYLPACGPVVRPDHELARAGVRRGITPDQSGDQWYVPGLFTMTGLGAKGFATAPLLAEYLVSCITGEPSPTGIELAGRIHPGRFAFRRIRRKG